VPIIKIGGGVALRLRTQAIRLGVQQRVHRLLHAAANHAARWLLITRESLALVCFENENPIPITIMIIASGFEFPDAGVR
jgi:hypothetical protein